MRGEIAVVFAKCRGLCVCLYPQVLMAELLVKGSRSVYHLLRNMPSVQP